ncbi:hypothetical protein FS837_009052 [Tulasnella sp. UAMH 9824]|nr:hypothetical protein FS837_009052 [Tulasnella sp. UAMH 9824]
MSFRTLTSLTPMDLTIGGITILVLLILDRRRRSRQVLHYPPGPRGLPLIGNLLDMPQTRFSLTWSKFGEKYGPLTWLTIPGQGFLIINSVDAAKDLLEKQPLIFIDRPRFTMTNELLGLNNYLLLSAANDLWRKQRAHLKHALSGAVVRSGYSPLLERKAREYLSRCAARPENVLYETNRIIGESIVQMTYGKLEDARGRDSIQIITRLLEIIVPSLQGYIVEVFPALQYLPSWLPGMKFKRDAAGWRKEIHEL